MSDADTPAIVEVENLTRRYEALLAVDAVSFAVSKGEMFGLIGPDGAGKTTTLRAVLGLLRPDAGRVRTCGLEPHRQARELSGKVGYLSQRFSLYGDLTVDENVGFFAQAHGVRRFKPRRDELLEMLRLTPFRRRLAERLSGGMKQKLALACTLIHEPELMVLDEPTTGVDPVSRREFWKILVGLQQDGMTILLTTPYLDEAERCQKVALMHRGRFLVVDAPVAIRDAAEGVMVEVLASPRRRAAELLLASVGAYPVTGVQAFGERLHVTVAAAAAQAGAVASALATGLEAAGIQVTASRPIGVSLEDVFIARIRESEAGLAASGGSS